MFGVGSSGVGFRGLGCSRPFRAQCVRCEDLGVQGVSVSSKFQGFRVQGGLWHQGRRACLGILTGNIRL